MAIGDIIVGIDIGTSRVSTVVGEVNNFGQVEVICNTSAKCMGLKKGKIIDEDEIAAAISKTIKDAENVRVKAFVLEDLKSIKPMNIAPITLGN